MSKLGSCKSSEVPTCSAMSGAEWGIIENSCYIGHLNVSSGAREV